jgi:hypothetical protein
VILDPSRAGFDAGAATFGCIFADEDDPGNLYLYYSGAKDTKWTHAAIGLALSRNGKDFRKLGEPLVDGQRGQFNSKESLTPAVVRLSNYYYMFFAGSKETSRPLHYRRVIEVAYSSDLKGPWEVCGIIAKPRSIWEGWSIDLGPSIVKLSEEEVLVFYSNVDNKALFNILFGPRFWHRYIGILKVKIRSPRSFEALRYEQNPLRHLNAPKGYPNESLFCPGYFSLGHKHFLLPSMSTYSVGFPYRQYVGLAIDDNPYFKNAKNISVLVDGPKEKKEILPYSKSEIALDTPSPIIMDDKLFLYYSVMDRLDGVWKIALVIFNKKSFEN